MFLITIFNKYWHFFVIYILFLMKYFPTIKKGIKKTNFSSKYIIKGL